MIIKNSLWRVGVALALTTTIFWGCSDDDDDSNNGTGGANGDTGGGPSTGGGFGTGGDGLGGEGGARELTDLIDTLIEQGSFTTLVALLQDADLDDTLTGAGPFTLFAPTDDAFAAFAVENPGFVLGLSEDERSNLLRYHVVEGRWLVADLEDGAELQTLADDDATFTVNVNGDVTITDGNDATTEDATITEADIEATNGVIQVIDGILVPPPAE